jgi:hypothetical protein
MSTFGANRLNFDCDIIYTPAKRTAANAVVPEKTQPKPPHAAGDPETKENVLPKKARVILAVDSTLQINELPIALSSLKPDYQTLIRTTKIGKKIVELKTHSKRTASGSLICFYFNGFDSRKYVYLCSEFPRCDNVARKGGLCKAHEAFAYDHR